MDQRVSTGKLNQPSITCPVPSCILEYGSVALENNYRHPSRLEVRALSREDTIRYQSPHQVTPCSEKKKRLDENDGVFFRARPSGMDGLDKERGTSTDTELCFLFSAMALIKHNLPKFLDPELSYQHLRKKLWKKNSCGNFSENPFEKFLVVFSISPPFR